MISGKINKNVIILLSLMMFLLWESTVWAQTTLDSDLTELSIEELMSIDVTLVTRKPQTILNSAAAVSVITENDIRRSGVTSIPEALRLVPGLQVARIDANKWAISSRGFNLRFANKLLVLMDGRTVYTPLFSGVFWNVQDVILEDIERIEVIRGPGASLWGSNAVNGVINIITKHAEDTQGGLVSAGIGTEERGFCGLRYGGEQGEKGNYRIYAKYFNRDGGVDDQGDDTSDEWDMSRAGFRSDWEPWDKSKLTVQGDIYNGEAGQTTTLTYLEPPYQELIEEDFSMFGGNILGRFQHFLSDSSDMTLQIYYDRTEREETLYSWYGDVLDIDFQHQFGLMERHELIWGFGYRFNHDNIDNSTQMIFEPDSREDHLFSAFIQDDIVLVKNRLKFILGSKFEHNDYTGFEFQPNARILWTPDESHTIWSSASRAVRSPSRYEEDMRFRREVYPPESGINSSSVPLALIYSGNRQSKSEEVIALELGYRTQPADSIFFDTATFINFYDNLTGYQPGELSLDTDDPAHLSQSVDKTYPGEGESYGVEFAGNWQPIHRWQLQFTYTYLKMDIKLKESAKAGADTYHDDNDPEHQFSIRSAVNLMQNIEFDFWIRYVDKVNGGRVTDYTTMDARLAWHLRKNLELSLVGQNLIESHHPEYIQLFFQSQPVEIERSVYAKIVWEF